MASPPLDHDSPIAAESLIPPSSASGSALDTTDLLLYGLVVVAWSTSWIATKMQLGVVAPEVSLMWRFTLAAAMMWLWALSRGHRMAWPLRSHVWFAALGVLLFSANFTLFYYGAIHIPSGLLAVIFSLASLINLLLAWLVMRQRIERRVALAGVVGLAGIALMFWPQVASTGSASLLGLGLCVAGTFCFCVGNLASAAGQRRGLSVVPATAWGMTYGALFLAAFAGLQGKRFTVEWTLPYLGSLLFLAMVASVVAFVAYLTLLGRIGGARAGYATVVFPVFALGISTLVEGYVWTWPALAGILLVLAGNVLVLRR